MALRVETGCPATDALRRIAARLQGGIGEFAHSRSIAPAKVSLRCGFAGVFEAIGSSHGVMPALVAGIQDHYPHQIDAPPVVMDCRNEPGNDKLENR